MDSDVGEKSDENEKITEDVKKKVNSDESQPASVQESSKCPDYGYSTNPNASLSASVQGMEILSVKGQVKTKVSRPNFDNVKPAKETDSKVESQDRKFSYEVMMLGPPDIIRLSHKDIPTIPCVVGNNLCKSAKSGSLGSALRSLDSPLSIGKDDSRSDPFCIAGCLEAMAEATCGEAQPDRTESGSSKRIETDSGQNSNQTDSKSKSRGVDKQVVRASPRNKTENQKTGQHTILKSTAIVKTVHPSVKQLPVTPRALHLRANSGRHQPTYFPEKSAFHRIPTSVPSERKSSGSSGSRQVSFVGQRDSPVRGNHQSKPKSKITTSQPLIKPSVLRANSSAVDGSKTRHSASSTGSSGSQRSEGRATSHGFTATKPVQAAIIRSNLRQHAQSAPKTVRVVQSVTTDRFGSKRNQASSTPRARESSSSGTKPYNQISRGHSSTGYNTPGRRRQQNYASGKSGMKTGLLPYLGAGGSRSASTTGNQSRVYEANHSRQTDRSSRQSIVRHRQLSSRSFTHAGRDNSKRSLTSALQSRMQSPLAVSKEKPGLKSKRPLKQQFSSAAESNLNSPPEAQVDSFQEMQDSFGNEESDGFGGGEFSVGDNEQSFGGVEEQPSDEGIGEGSFGVGGEAPEEELLIGEDLSLGSSWMPLEEDEIPWDEIDDLPITSEEFSGFDVNDGPTILGGQTTSSGTRTSPIGSANHNPLISIFAGYQSIKETGYRDFLDGQALITSFIEAHILKRTAYFSSKYLPWLTGADSRTTKYVTTMVTYLFFLSMTRYAVSHNSSDLIYPMAVVLLAASFLLYFHVKKILADYPLETQVCSFQEEIESLKGPSEDPPGNSEEGQDSFGKEKSYRFETGSGGFSVGDNEQSFGGVEELHSKADSEEKQDSFGKENSDGFGDIGGDAFSVGDNEQSFGGVEEQNSEADSEDMQDSFANEESVGFESGGDESMF